VPAGDACQCGDVTGDGSCGVADLAVLDRIATGAPAAVYDFCRAFRRP